MIGVVYVPPIDSSYNGIKQDIFNVIELEYSKCANNYDIFLCGDFNARTGTLPDIITDEFTAFNGGQLNFACFDILSDSQRYNMDTKANTHKSVKDYDHVTVYKAYHKYIWNVSRTDQYKISLRRD